MKITCYEKLVFVEIHSAIKEPIKRWGRNKIPKNTIHTYTAKVQENNN